MIDNWIGLFQKCVCESAFETAFLLFFLCLIKIFFDLDDTLWAFSLNARDTYEEMYWKYEYNRFFDSFEHYYSLYHHRNLELWAEYADGKVTKEELNRQRYLYPLKAVGICDSALAKAYEKDALAAIPTKSKLMPHAREVLEYLSSKYNLYILSNGFKELQSHKMHSSGIDKYFKKIVLSDDIGVLKPLAGDLLFCPFRQPNPS